MRFATVCSGIEAMSQAWKPMGWTPVWYSETDKFASAVLDVRHPEAPNLGDMTQLHNKEILNEPIDLIGGGTPCQSFSVAGLRKGMDDPRGNLTLEFLRVIERTRPTWVVWENVPGVLSSSGGRDFGSFVRGLEIIGYQCTWRVLDSQYYGLAQRRKRVFLVGYPGDWRPAAAVLLERQSLRGDSPPSREKGEEVAGPLGGGSGNRGWCDDLDRAGAFIPETTHTLTRRHDSSEDGCGRGVPIIPDISPAVISKWAKGTGGPAGDECQNLVACFENHGQDSRVKEIDVAPTIAGKAGTGGNNLPLVLAIRTAHTGGNGAGASYETAHTVDPGNGQAVGVSIRGRGLELCNEPDVAPAVKGGGGGSSKPHVFAGSAVRRLTPRECERLQGFPDDYTRIPWGNKTEENCPDGPRYRVIGNSIAVPVLGWIGKRIKQVEGICVTTR